MLALPGSLLVGVAAAAEAGAFVRRSETGPTAADVWRRAVRPALWAVALPLALLLLNALRVRNCDPLEGLAFYGAMTAGSYLFAATLGAAAGLATGRAGRAAVLFALVWLAWVLRDALQLYLEPPIFVFSPFAGFVSGAIYDDVISLDSRLAAYRALNAAQLVVLWMVVSAAWSPEARRLQGRRLRARNVRWWALVAAVAVAAGVLFGLRARIGFELDRGAIQRQLGGEISSERVVIHYDVVSIGPEEAARLLEDHHHHLDVIADTLGEGFRGVVHSYVYRDPAQKRRLMGGARVDVAKPWLGEIHLNRTRIGASVVRHELAHVVLGQYAPPPLHLPVRWRVIPHAALIEGCAEALEWMGSQHTLHEWSAAMRAAGLAPSLQRLMGPDGFLSQPAGKAYTLSGSFARWLLDTRGPERFKAMYATADIEGTYDRPLGELLGEWNAFLDAIAPGPDLVEVTRQIYDVKGLFHRVCPLETARLRAASRTAALEGRYDDTLDLLREILSFTPDDPRARAPLVGTLSLLGRAEECRAEAARLLDSDGVNGSMRALTRERVADVAWRSGETTTARRIYDSLVDAPALQRRRRNVLVKRDLVTDGEREPILGPFLMGIERRGPDYDPEVAQQEAIDYLTEAVVDLPGDALALYLLGRRLYIARRFAPAVGPLKTALALLNAPGGAETQRLDPATVASLDREARRLMARSMLLSGQTESARRMFERLAAETPWAGSRLEFEDWARRARLRP